MNSELSPLPTDGGDAQVRAGETEGGAGIGPGEDAVVGFRTGTGNEEMR